MRHTSNEIWYAEQRDLAVAARDYWKARAERAEAQLTNTQAENDALRREVELMLHQLAGMRDCMAENDALRAELATAKQNADAIYESAAETEVRLNAALDALRAELDAVTASQWRPVTEKPGALGYYLVYDADGQTFWSLAAVWPYRVAEWDGRRWDTGLDGLIDYWQPLPAAPDAGQEARP